MGVTTTLINKPFNPRAQDQSPKGFNRAKLFSGKALDFDGVNDDINEQTISVSSTSFSVSFYAKADNYASPLCAVSIGTSGTFDLVFYPYDDFIGNGLRIYDAQISSNLLYGVTAELGVYNLFTFQCDGEYLEVYINGQFAKKEARTYSSTYTAIKIGSILGGTQYYNGQIAGFKIFNTALTAAQVADLYNNPEKVVPTGVSNTALKLWLPMMEGAGTTAYDGSGNGNHGTISGATYVNGVGAPVAQSAVMDWNKGVNLTNYSEDGSVWGTGGNIPTITQDQPDPFAGTRAQRIQMDKAGNYAQIVKQHTLISASVEYTAKMWLKAVSGTPTIAINYNGSGGSWQNVTLTNEWAEYEVTRVMNSDYEYSHNILIGNPAPGTSSTADFYIYGLQIQLGDTAGPYVPTFGTAQTTPVLLPQGLTTGRDITGVNLFENVRKQGALNLDGNSWAEVHDNASLDITSAISVEAWVYWNGEANKGLLGRWETTPASKSFVLYKASSTKIRFYVSNDGSAEAFIQNSTSLSAGWNHIVGVYDGSNIIAYLNGSADGSASYSSGINANTLPLEIGRHSYDSSYAYNDDIAQPRIYNRALTAEEVQRSYDSGKNIFTNS